MSGWTLTLENCNHPRKSRKTESCELLFSYWYYTVGEIDINAIQICLQFFTWILLHFSYLSSNFAIAILVTLKSDNFTESNRQKNIAMAVLEETINQFN